MPDVVNISVELKEQTATQGEENVGKESASPSRPSGHAFRSVPQALLRTTVPAEKVTALGSGFIVDPAAYIVTNNQRRQADDNLSGH
jgi:S1-C subfamily serine protease